MANFLNFVIILIFTMYNFNFIFCQFYLQPGSQIRTRISRKSGLGSIFVRKAADLPSTYTNEFLKELEARMKGPGSKSPQQWQAAVDPNPKKTITDQIEDLTQNVNLAPEKIIRQDRKKKEKSLDVENNVKKAEGKKKSLRKRHHSKMSSDKFNKQKAPEHTKINCNEKCFTPQCEVECNGQQTSAACSAPGCKALTRGEDSASLCSGESCHALCYKEECISGCEGLICIVKCNGKKCHAVAEGEKSGSTCEKDGCMAYGNGLKTNIKCSGVGCQAQCMGESCMAECNGTNCVAGCTGKNCQAMCKGKNCQELEHIGEKAQLVNLNAKDISEDDEYDTNKDESTTTKATIKKLNKVEKYVTERDLDSEAPVKLEYSVDVRLTPVLAHYIKDKVSQFKDLTTQMLLLRSGLG